MLQALLISNGLQGLEKYYVSNELVHYTTCFVTGDFNPDLTPYDLLVVPNGSDHVAMLKIKDQVSAFLDAGKALVCCDGFFTAWVPGNQWLMDNSRRTLDVRYTPGPDAHGLLENLPLDELNFSHGMSGWWSCGYIQAAPGAEVLLADTWQRPIVVLDEVSTPGRMLLTASGPLADVTYAGKSETASVTLYRNFLRLLSSETVPAHG
ncbi:hypothetical protein [Hymenobacter rubripertinctus]|nr:hypothetical protein [Hymenobacter rubripertinctus]